MTVVDGWNVGRGRTFRGQGRKVSWATRDTLARPRPPTMQDRDENAALNMRLLLVLQLLGRDRPAVFCRQEGGVD